jgi:hypothetical protein
MSGIVQVKTVQVWDSRDRSKIALLINTHNDVLVKSVLPMPTILDSARVEYWVPREILLHRGYSNFLTKL